MTGADGSGLPAALEAAAVEAAAEALHTRSCPCGFSWAEVVERFPSEAKEWREKVPPVAVLRAVLLVGLAHERERIAALIASKCCALGQSSRLVAWLCDPQTLMDEVHARATRSPEGTPTRGATTR